MNIVIKQHNLINPGTININKRIGNKIIKKENIKYKGFDFNGAVHSINIEEKYFTNFVKSYDKKIYIELKKIFDDIFWKKDTIDNRLILLSNDNQNEDKVNRLNEIIKENLKISKVPELMKFKPKTLNNDQTLDGVRIYVYYNKVYEEFELYLIDLYHLGVDALNRKINRYDLKGRYSRNSMFKKCISKITDEYINSSN